MNVAAAVDQYLTGMRCVLWPNVSFDLTDEKQRIAATLWLIDTMREVECIRQK